jgi:tight adherence protein B
MISLLLILHGLVLIAYAARGELLEYLQVNRRLQRLTTRPGITETGSRSSWRLPPALAAWAERAGMQPARLPLLAGGVALFGASFAVLIVPGYGVFLGPAVTLTLLFGVLHLRVERRRRQLSQALPGFLDRLRQQLTIGASASQALERATAGSPAALRDVFAPVLWRLRHGTTLNDALVWLAERERSAELGSLAAAVAASMRFGGRLSEAVGNLARTLRDRQRIEQEMKAATSEVRASAFVLGLLPIGVTFAMFAISPIFRTYFGPGGEGQPLVPWLLGAYITGALLMRRIARPKF